MNPTREEALFAVALVKPVEKRPMFLDAVCDGDDALRQRLEALLAAHDQPDTLLATQAEAARPTIKLDLADAPGGPGGPPVNTNTPAGSRRGPGGDPVVVGAVTASICRSTEWLLLGSVAVHFEGKLLWDAAKGEISNNPEANRWVQAT